MTDDRHDPPDTDERDPALGGAVAEAQQLEQNLHVSAETARLTAEDRLSSGPGKPASRDVDDERAARARASEPDV